jgi:hypothetical protein
MVLTKIRIYGNPQKPILYAAEHIKIGDGLYLLCFSVVDFHAALPLGQQNIIIGKYCHSQRFIETLGEHDSGKTAAVWSISQLLPGYYQHA